MIWTNTALLLCLLSVSHTEKTLKRTKRALTFPEGSTFSFAFCMTIKVLTPDDPDIFTEAVALATSYDLPNNTETLGIAFKKPKVDKLSRIQRSLVYSKMETVLERFGVPGKQCVLRAICEGAQQLRNGDENMFAQILKILLKFPEERPVQDEPVNQWVYLGAYKAGLHNYNCPDLYPSCDLSLVGYLIGMKPITV